MLALVIGLMGLGGIIFTALRYNRDDTTAIVNQQAAITSEMKVLNDELHSSYRIRDQQITVVNRQMQDARFTITVLENRRNEEQHWLPAHYVVNTWDVATGAEQLTVPHPGVVSVEFTPDGRRLLMSGRGARLWSVDPLAAAEARRPRDLTAAERARFGLNP